MGIRKKLLATLAVVPVLLGVGAAVGVGVGAVSPSAWASSSAAARTSATSASAGASAHARAAVKKPARKPARKPAAKPARKPAKKRTGKPAKDTAGKGTSAQTTYEKQVAALPARFTRQKLDWRPCDAKITEASAKRFWAGTRCALLTAPLDYARPGGQIIKVAIDEELAAPGKKHLGILMTNPGGPGGAGLFMPASFANGSYAYSGLHDYFDIVGMNPRGIGPSTDEVSGSTDRVLDRGATTLNCATNEIRYQQPTLPGWASATLQSMADSAAYQEAACQHTADGVRPYITTLNTARDIDLLRIVLGRPKISYYGVSYGTFLGAVYGAMFPHNLNRMVLDGSMSPKVSWYDEATYDNEAAEHNFDAFAAWAVASNQGLGDTPQAVRTTVDTLYADTEKSAPQPLGGYTPARLSKDIGEFTRYRPEWTQFAASLRNALAADSGGKVDPTITQDVDSASVLVPAPSGIDPRGASDIGDGTYNAILCNWPWPKPDDVGYRVYENNIAYWTKTFPYAGTVSVSGPRACTYRSYQPEKLPVITARGPYPKGLVISSEGDTQTPLSMGTEMARTLGFDLITITNDGTHGMAFAGNMCVTTPVVHYFVDGTLPGDISCPTINPPGGDASLTSGAAAAAAQEDLDGLGVAADAGQ
jgi:pimeloyl-ACP methyl ester carboxylesterase